MLGRNEVEGKIGERTLPAPSRGRVQVEHELLHRLTHLLVGEPVVADEGGEIGVDVVERLCPGPLVLKRAEEVDHLAQRGVEVLRRARARAVLEVEPLQQQVAQAPPGAVSRKAERQVVDVEVAVFVRLPDLFGVLVEGVLGLQRPGKVQHQALERVRHVGVLVHTPVGLRKVGLDGLGDVEEGGLVLAQFAAFLAIDDIATGHGVQARFHQHLFDVVLHLFLFGYLHVVEFGLDLARKALREQWVLDAVGLQRLENGFRYAVGRPRFQTPVAFANLLRHVEPSGGVRSPES